MDENQMNQGGYAPVDATDSAQGGTYTTTDGGYTTTDYSYTPQEGTYTAPEAPEMDLVKAADGIAETKKRNYERYMEEGEWTPQQTAPTGTAPFSQDPYQGVQNTYQSSAPGSYYGSQPSYESSAGLEEPVSVGEWIVSLLLMMVPCVNIVLVFVWAFSKTEKRSKSNFFKAELIMVGIVAALYVVLLIVMVLFFGIATRY